VRLAEPPFEPSRGAYHDSRTVRRGELVLAFQVGDSTVLELLDKSYGIRSPRSLSLLSGSVMNPNWSVETDSGRYVVRCFVRNRDRARISFQMAYHMALARMGFPVPRVIPNGENGVVTLHSGETWVLYEWIDGADYDYESPRQLEASGRLLGNLHTNLEHICLTGYVEPAGFPPYSGWADNGEMLLQESLRDGTRLGLSSDDATFALKTQRWMAQTLSAADYEELPKLFIWGDFHGRNMKFRDEQIVGLFDFDVVRWETPAYDLGSGAFMFCRRSRSDPTIRLDAVDRLVRAYALERPVGQPEAVAALPLLIYRYITDLYLPDPLPPGSDVSTQARKAIRILRAVWEVRRPVMKLLTSR